MMGQVVTHNSGKKLASFPSVRGTDWRGWEVATADRNWVDKVSI